jgi:carbon-monoxide dehydrogenase iron sulfur subunit
VTLSLAGTGRDWTDTGGSHVKRIYALEEFCIGCRLCEVHCIVAHSRSKDLVKAFKEENPRPLARIKVMECRPVTFALQCRFCEEPLCVQACLTGAMHMNEETGMVEWDEAKCVGCRTCVIYCPYGAIRPEKSQAKGRIISKCDMCAETGLPACVAACPNGALYYGEEKPEVEL